MTPGEDSGYVYMEASATTSLTPIDNDFERFTWKWLLNGKWVNQPDMRLICLDGTDPADLPTDDSEETLPPQQQLKSQSLSRNHNHFYEVEYFDPKEKQPTTYVPITAYLITDVYPKQFREAGFTVVPKLLPAAADRLHGLLDISAKKLHIVTDVEILTTYGGLSLIQQPVSNSTERDSKGAKTKQTGKADKADKAGSAMENKKKAVLVNVEHGTGLWRLTYRYLPNTHSDEIVSYNRGQSLSNREITVELNTMQGFTHSDDNTPIGSSAAISVLYPSLQQLTEERESLVSQLLADKVQVGDYLWTWYAPAPLHPTDDLTSPNQGHGREEAVSELLLRCRSKIGKTKFVFEYHLAHRMEVMRRTVLSNDIDLLVIDLEDLENDNNDSTGLIYGTLGHAHHAERVALHQWVYIGQDVIGFIMEYIDYKEGVLGGFSSCYMYHAAYSLPQQLLYANEILCVLVGAKPVTMVSLSFLL
jgi:hypothetical protein